MMGRYKILSFFALAAMIMSLSVVASAQWRDRRGNDGYYGNTNYGRNIGSTVKNLKRKSQRFEDLLDSELDDSRYDGSRFEDQLNELAERFKDAAENLEDEYGRGRNYNRSYDEAQRVLRAGSQLDNALSRSRIQRNSRLRSSWSSIERDLRTIARAYNMSYNGRNTRYNRNGQWNRNRNRRGTYNRRNNYNLRSTIVSLKYKSKRFEDRLDRGYGNGRWGTRNSGRLEGLSDRFHDAVKDLEDEYNGYRDHRKSYGEARRVLSLGEQIDREISYNRTNRQIRNDWNSIERDLNTIARAYNLRYNGRSGGVGRIGDIWRNFPF